MYLKQYYLACLSHASYLIVDEESGEAAVIDPQRDIDQYLDDASAKGWHIRHVLLTHMHADFLAGHLELRASVGARIHLGRKATAEFAFTPMTESEPLMMGKTRLRFLETPGHTPESVCILVDDLNRDTARPQAVLTGDTLFIGDVGRPDLMASVGVSAEELASSMYDSLHQKLMTLPDETLVYPAHGAGSLCGKSLSSDTVSTIGAQRESNEALKPMSREAFIQMLTEGQTEAPAYFMYDAVLNGKEHPVLEDSLRDSLRPLSLERILEGQHAGASVVDVRDPDDYCALHLRGSLNIGLGGKFATWAGSLLDQERPILLVAMPGREREAAMRLGRIGFDHVAGYLEGGAGVLQFHPQQTSTLERINGAELQHRLAAEGAPSVLDVRAPGEYHEKRIPGSLHMPLNRLQGRLDQIPRDRDLVVQCAGGYRSTIACSILRAHGYDRITDLAEGLKGWSGPTESG